LSKNKNISHYIKKSFEQEKYIAPKKIWEIIDTSLNKNKIDNAVKSSFENEYYSAPIFDFSKVSTSQIDEKVKESFETQKQTAPLFNFDQVKLFESELDQKVSDSFEAERNVLPDSIWRNIQNKLDVSRTWETIIPQIKINTFSWRKLGIASLIISVISLVPSTLKNPFLTTTQLFSELNISGNTSTYYTPLTLQPSTQVQTQKQHNPALNPLLNIASNRFTNNKTAAITLEQTNLTESANTQVNKDKINHINLIETPQSLTEQINETPFLLSTIEIPEKKIKNQSKFKLGLYASINNTWLNNEDTRSSFDKNSLFSSKMAFGESRGLTATYDFNAKVGITGAFLIQSKVKNKIGYYDNGYFKLRTTELNYTKGFLLVDFYKTLPSKTSKITRNIVHSKLAFGVGPYLAHQKSSLIYTDDVITSYNSTFTDWDYGLKLQFGQEKQWNSLTFGYGINSNIGMKNILKNQSNIASNINIGAFATLKYQLF